MPHFKFQRTRDHPRPNEERVSKRQDQKCRIVGGAQKSFRYFISDLVLAKAWLYLRQKKTILFSRPTQFIMH